MDDKGRMGKSMKEILDKLSDQKRRKMIEDALADIRDDQERRGKNDQD